SLQIPITARVSGGYPVRVLGLSVSVEPLEGAPDVTSTVQFAPATGLGQPAFVAGKGAANYSAAWLNNTVAGISDGNVVGVLQITIPTNATSTSAYAIHFDHASASPNGIAKFAKQTRTGLITLSDR